MKNKYVAISGLAFSESKDMIKLSDYAKDGWILDGIVGGGFFYKLRKDVPREIIYNVDYQTDATEEYFNIMKEAGWEHIVSVENHIRIFSAIAGTKPIYSDKGTEKDKYITIKNQTKKGSVYTFIIGIVLFLLMIISSMIYRPLFIFTLGLLVVDIVVFVFNFMPYVAFNSRIKSTYNDEKSIENNINKVVNTSILFLSALVIVFGGYKMIDNRSITTAPLLLIILGSFLMIFTIFSQKKTKKLNK